jgi:hypothetical protein
MFDASEPKRRLANARFPLEHEGSGPIPLLLEEGGDGGKLLVPADDLEHALLRADRDSGVGGGQAPIFHALNRPPVRG